LHRIAYYDVILIREAVAREERIHGFDAQDEFACFLNRDEEEAASEADSGFRWMKMSLGAAQEDIYASLTERSQRFHPTRLSHANPSGEFIPPFGTFGLEVGFSLPPGT